MNIIAAVCLLLWGITLLRLGVTRGFGAQLQRFLAASTKNRVRAFLSGMAMTTLLQSSTATVLVVAAFAGQGMVTAASGLAIVLGADVGTTLVAQLLSLDMSLLAPVLMVLGYIFFTLENSSGKLKNIGRIMIGLSLMLMSLAWIRETAAPLKDSEILPMILQALEKDPFFAMALTAVLTWLAHSSLAIVLLLMSLVASGVLPIDLGFALVLGANIGGTVPPLIATLRDNPDAMRIPLGNMLVRIVGVCAIMPVLPFVEQMVPMIDPDPARQLVNFHTAFNIVLALAFLPFTGIISNILYKALPPRPPSEDPGNPRYLNLRDVSTPSVALSAAARETLRIGDLVQQMLEDTLKIFRTNDEKLLAKVREEDDTIDKLYAAIKTYMAKLTQEFMDPQEAQRYVQILTFSTNLEHAGDVIDKNLLPLADKKIRGMHSFSDAGFKEIEAIHRLVVESVQLAQSIFISGNIEMARKLLEDKEAIRKAEIDGMATHIDRLRGGVPETIATSSLHLDIIRDYRRINTYVCTVAYALLEEKGQLRQTRLIPEAEVKKP